MQVNLKNTDGALRNEPTLGLLRLDTRFPRFEGDGGRADSFPCPVLELTVPQAYPSEVVEREANGLVERFVEGAQQLVAAGADMITTSCGFLILHQARLQTAVSVPVVSSALLSAPFLEEALNTSGQRVGILTISANSLQSVHLSSAGAALDTAIAAPDRAGPFVAPILNDELHRDFVASEADLVQCARSFVADHADLGVLLLECTNMAPHSAAIQRATGLPVLSLVNLMQSLLANPEYDLRAATQTALA